jgi:hypothetical protein
MLPVTEMVSRPRDALQREAHGADLGHDLDVEAGGVVILQVFDDLLDQLVFVRAVGSSQKWPACRVAGAGDGQLDPVADRCVLDLAHAPDVTGFDVLRQQHFTGRVIDDVGDAGFGNFKGLVVRAVFFGLLGHQTDVRHGAHGLRIEVAMPFDEVDHLLVDAGKGRFRHDALAVVLLAVSAPHLAALTDHGRHGGINDNVVGRMEVGDALGRIDHGQTRTMFLAGVQVADDFVAQGFRQGLDLLVEVDHAVIDVDAQLRESLGVLLESILVVDLDAVAEDDRVRDLHHRRLDVQREQDAGLRQSSS